MTPRVLVNFFRRGKTKKQQHAKTVNVVRTRLSTDDSAPSDQLENDINETKHDDAFASSPSVISRTQVVVASSCPSLHEDDELLEEDETAALNPWFPKPNSPLSQKQENRKPDPSIDCQRASLCGWSSSQPRNTAIHVPPNGNAKRASRRQNGEPWHSQAIECIFDKDSLPELDESSSSSSQDYSEKQRRFSARQETMDKPPCTCEILPPLDTSQWWQRPLLLRPTPNSGTKIRGIRFDKDVEYFWNPEMNNAWWQCLQQRWGQQVSGSRTLTCGKCCILPINNGTEANGESLVVDFETDLFHGSLMVRIRHAEGSTPHPYDDNVGYFAGNPLQYQAIISGRFLQEIPFTELVTGNRLNRPCGKLPPKWIMWSTLKVIGIFAPQLQTQLDGPKPYSLSPLGSAPRTIYVEDSPPALLGDDREEPTDPKLSITGKAYPISNPLERARARKRAFDRLYSQSSREPMTEVNKVYTFGFLQHLFDYRDFSIDLGTFRVEIKDVLDGQPIQLMAAWGDKPLWSFDLWNECLLEGAKKYITPSAKQA